MLPDVRDHKVAPETPVFGVHFIDGVTFECEEATAITGACGCISIGLQMEVAFIAEQAADSIEEVSAEAVASTEEERHGKGLQVVDGGPNCVSASSKKGLQPYCFCVATIALWGGSSGAIKTGALCLPMTH